MYVKSIIRQSVKLLIVKTDLMQVAGDFVTEQDLLWINPGFICYP